MERTATYYPAQQILIFQLGQRLWCDFTVKLLRRLPFLWQRNCHGNRFKGLTLKFDSRHATFNDSCAGRCSLWKLHALKRLSFHGWYARVWLSSAWSNVREKCAFAVKIQLRTHEDRQGITSNGLVTDLFSISCYIMPIRVILLMMDAFGAGCCSRIQANVAFITLSLLYIAINNMPQLSYSISCLTR